MKRKLGNSSQAIVSGSVDRTALIVASLMLFAMGLVMVFNTTAAEIIDRSLDLNTRAALYKQLLFGGLGILVGYGLYRLGHKELIALARPLLIALVFLLLLVYLPGIGHTLNGARRWVGVGWFSFQPAECAKILLPIAYIDWYLKAEKPIEWKPLVKMLAQFSIPMVLILLQPDNGTTVILMALLGALFFLTEIRSRYWLAPFLALALIGGAVGWQMPHVRSRIEVYLHPETDLKGKGHQPHQALIAAGSGRLLGRGLGESLQKLNYLPEARSDYIAAIFAEEFGFLGMLVLIILYMTITAAGFSIAFKASSMAGFYLAAILTFLIALQAFVNLGVVSGLLPSKGMTLPFFSQGGSSLVVNIGSLALLLDIGRRG
jgi:cell division protein FtsW